MPSIFVLVLVSRKGDGSGSNHRGLRLASHHIEMEKSFGQLLNDKCLSV